MQREPATIPVLPQNASQLGLEFAHRLVAMPNPLGAAELLAAFAQAFAADGAGAAALAGGAPLARRSSLAPPARWPWDVDANLRGRLRSERAGVLLAHPDGGCFLVFAAPGLTTTGWLIWLESRARTTWSAAENAAFALAASAVARALDSAAANGGEPFDRSIRQQQLEHAADAVRRVAHDYGNVLTTILGFSELALAQPLPPASPLRRYLTEVHHAATNGAELTQQLQRFARRQADAPRPCPLAPIFIEERARLQTAEKPAATIDLALPADLPPAAIDGDPLRLIIRALLENAVEATNQRGNVTVKARPVTIAAEECLDYYGDVRPGPHVEVRITDTGDGFVPEVLRRLFAEPFYSTKPRRRGFGLHAVYGVLHAHRGGLRLSNGPERGALVRFVLPIAVVPAAAITPSGTKRSSGEKVLIVDDDPLVLRFVANALEKAGYRVHTAPGATEALATHAAHRGEPFRLVLSDVSMPQVSGVELAQRLLKEDSDVHVLFMSGHAPGGDVPTEISGRVCELLQKPFRSEGLLRAVRSALERGPVRRAAPHAVGRDESIVSPSR